MPSNNEVPPVSVSVTSLTLNPVTLAQPFANKLPSALKLLNKFKLEILAVAMILVVIFATLAINCLLKFTLFPVTTRTFAFPSALIFTFAFARTTTLLFPFSMYVPAPSVRLVNKYPSPLKKLAVARLPKVALPVDKLPVILALDAFTVVTFAFPLTTNKSLIVTFALFTRSLDGLASVPIVTYALATLFGLYKFITALAFCNVLALIIFALTLLVSVILLADTLLVTFAFPVTIILLLVTTTTLGTPATVMLILEFVVT